MGTNKVVEPEVVEPEQAEAEKPRTTRKAITRTTVEKFVADEPVEFEEDAPEESEELELDASEDEEAEEIQLDPLAKFAQSIGQSTGYYLYVTRLPDPQHARGLYRTPCIEETQYGWIPFDADNFVSDVQNLTGSGGRYRLQVRQSSGAVVRQVTTNLADPFTTNGPAKEQQVANAPQNAPTFRSFAEQAREFAETAKALGLAPRSQQPPPAPAAPHTPALPPPSAAEQLRETASMVETITTIAERIHPPRATEGEKGAIGQIAELLDVVGRHAPAIFPMLGMMFQRRAQQPNGQPPMIEAPPPAPPINPMFQMLEPLRPAVDFICKQLANNAPYDATLQLIEEIKERPGVEIMLGVMVQTASPELLNTLAEFTGHRIILSLDHSAEWIEGLQGQLKEDAEESGQPEESTQPEEEQEQEG